MVTLVNRRELIVLFSQQKLYAVQAALHGAGIPYHTKFSTPLGRIGGRARANPFQDYDVSHDYKVYVRKDDYDRAVKAIQSVLRGK